MGCVRLGAPTELALKLRDELGLKWFVETGTYKCGTTIWAAQNFEHVATIEMHEPRYLKNLPVLEKFENVKAICGDSRTELRKNLPDEPALLWLDAHWCGNYEISVGSPGECPLMEELQAVREFDAVLIDDARLFTGRPERPHDPQQWPTYEQIKAALPGRYFTIIEDVIVALPLELRCEMNVLCLTSNKYAHMVAPFAYLFKKFWSQDLPVKVLRYDVRAPKVGGNFKQTAIGRQEDFTWSSGLRSWLEFAGPEIFILMLEDYWIHKPVDQEAVAAAWNIMEKRKEIGKIDISGDLLKRKFSEYREIDGAKLVQAAPESYFQTSTQAAIWRKSFLLEWLKDSESAWQFEKSGGRRMIYARQSGKAVKLVLGTDPGAVSYVNACGGEGNLKGKYDHKKIPGWMWEELMENGLVRE